MMAGRGRDSPHGPPPAQIRASGLRSTRLLARVIASLVSAVGHSLSHHTLFRPCVRCMGGDEQPCLCAAAFPPSPPLQHMLVCSGTSLVLCSGPTAWLRSSSAYGHILPDAIGAGLLRWYGLLHGRCTQALPIGSSRCVCACSGLRPRRVLPSLAKAGGLLLPSVRPNHVGTRKLHAYFGAQY
jgi:hypothetical protein